jgi:hypothetical protein
MGGQYGSNASIFLLSENVIAITVEFTWMICTWGHLTNFICSYITYIKGDADICGLCGACRLCCILLPSDHSERDFALYASLET